MPSKVLVVASKIPDTGFTTRPAMPFSPPIKKPPIPLSCAPSTGEVKTPVIPFANPLAMLLAPLASPCPMCELLSFLIFCLYLENSSSNAREESPFPTDPVTDSALLKAPSKVFFTSEPAPLAIAFPPSRGPLLNPSVGNSIKSLNPEAIL